MITNNMLVCHLIELVMKQKFREKLQSSRWLNARNYTDPDFVEMGIVFTIESARTPEYLFRELESLFNVPHLLLHLNYCVHKMITPVLDDSKP